MQSLITMDNAEIFSQLMSKSRGLLSVSDSNNVDEEESSTIL